MVRRRGGRKRALGTRAPMLVPQWPNDRWSLDFVSDQFIDGRMRILVVVDDCTRECLALVPDTSISGTRVARELDRLLVAYGNRPHSRLGWLSPATYAAQRRSAALRSTDGSAPRTAATTAQQGITDVQTTIAAG